MKAIKSLQEGTKKSKNTSQLLVDYSTLTAYERLYDAEALTNAIFTLAGESVLVRNSFRWKKDGEAIADAYASMPMEQVCAERSWRIVERYGEHLAIVIPE